MSIFLNQCLPLDALTGVSLLASAGARVQTCITSPPYFGLRDYGHAQQIGLETTPDEYIRSLVEVFRAVRSILSDDGTLWLNIGDSYTNERKWGGSNGGKHVQALHGNTGVGRGKVKTGLKPKDLIGIPWMLAFALRADGWYLRQDIIWHKPNPMPESVRDRCTKAHEYVFLLSKSERYFFDSDAVKERATQSSVSRWAQNIDAQAGSDRVPGKSNGPMRAVGGPRSRRNSFSRVTKDTAGDHGQKPQFRPDRADIDYADTRNKRSVWTVATRPYKGAHFATFPPALIEPCVLAGSKPGDTVLDPFMGSGTTAQVARDNQRSWIGCEINPSYIELQRQRLSK